MKTKTFFSWARFVLVVIMVVGHALPTLAQSPTLAESNPAFGGDQTQDQIERDVLLLARAVYSETKKEKNGEMVKVACVIRNRVETEYRGTTYEEVIFAKNQFSGFSPWDKQYWVNMTMDYSDTNSAWRNALKVSEMVYEYGDLLCHYPKTVRHFYSPIAVSKTPNWALGREPYEIIYASDGRAVRFAFYDGVK